MADVFMSHVEEDAQTTVVLAASLETAGFSTWYYERDSIPGVSYLIQTGEAISNCQAIVLLISANSLGSHQVTKEVVRAHEAGKAFVPVLVDVSHVEFQNRQPEWREAIGGATSITLLGRSVESVAEAIVKGLHALNILPSQSAEIRQTAQLNLFFDLGFQLIQFIDRAKEGPASSLFQQTKPCIDRLIADIGIVGVADWATNFNNSTFDGFSPKIRVFGEKAAAAFRLGVNHRSLLNLLDNTSIPAQDKTHMLHKSLAFLKGSLETLEISQHQKEYEHMVNSVIQQGFDESITDRWLRLTNVLMKDLTENGSP